MNDEEEELVEREVWLSQEEAEAFSAEAARLHCSEEDIMRLAVQKKIISDQLSEILQELKRTGQDIERLNNLMLESLSRIPGFNKTIPKVML
ncbi:hypothetical protein AGMMS49991_00420 [Spirochaetia bacterium]|nr:hypothetical protein AGMMS49991_00420 [Spirochaetia bacterium]